MALEDWVELCSVMSEVEASIIRTLLEAEEIPVVVTSHLAASAFPSLSQLKIFVPKESRELAEQILENSEVPEENEPG